MKKIVPVAIIIVVLIIIILLGGLLYLKGNPNNFPCWPPFCMPGRPMPDQTAGWKTYTNSTYGISFKYPNDLKMIDNSKYQTDGTYLSLSLQAGYEEGIGGIPVFSFKIVKNNFNEYIDKLKTQSYWYEGVNFCENINSVIDKTEYIKFAGLNAKKITLNTCLNFGPIILPDENKVEIFTEKGNQSYILTISPIIYSKDNGSYYKISNTFISTFKFIK